MIVVIILLVVATSALAWRAFSWRFHRARLKSLDNLPPDLDLETVLYWARAKLGKLGWALVEEPWWLNIRLAASKSGQLLYLMVGDPVTTSLRTFIRDANENARKTGRPIIVLDYGYPTDNFNFTDCPSNVLLIKPANLHLAFDLITKAKEVELAKLKQSRADIPSTEIKPAPAGLDISDNRMQDSQMTNDAPSSAPIDPFFQFMESGFDSIVGWPGRKASVLFMHSLRPLLGRHGETGGVCEIGVHHGKYFIAMHNMLNSRGMSLGIDLFEDQAKNIDGSGKGSLPVCSENIAKYAHNPNLVRLMNRDSLTLRQREINEITESHGSFSIFSVDGGHTCAHALYDLATATQLTSPAGLISIDDLFHPDWPGVTEAVAKFMLFSNAPFIPLFMTRKKLFMCHVSVQAEYLQFMMDNRPTAISTKMVDFFGQKIPSINFGTEY